MYMQNFEKTSKMTKNYFGMMGKVKKIPTQNPEFWIPNQSLELMLWSRPFSFTSVILCSSLKKFHNFCPTLTYRHTFFLITSSDTSMAHANSDYSPKKTKVVENKNTCIHSITISRRFLKNFARTKTCENLLFLRNFTSERKVFQNAIYSLCTGTWNEIGRDFYVAGYFPFIFIFF